jgi:hypothetical protein
MPRLHSVLLDDGEFVVWDPEDVVKLLAHKREERFEGERATRFFQFRTWMLFSDQDDTKYVKWAGLIAAVKWLELTEDDYFVDEETARLREEGEPIGMIDLTDKPPQTLKRIETLSKHKAVYRQIYDRLIGKRGGLLAVLHTPSPTDFDQAINSRIDRMHIISDLIDYRLRYIQHGSGSRNVTADPNGANHNHAMFFCWWPTHEVQSGRGKTSPEKSVSIKTMRTWWKKFERSALFIYPIQKHGFQQLPMDTDDESFVDNLLHESNDTAEILRFLGAYAYLVDTFREAHSDLIYVSVPDSIPRISLATSPFSKTELETISQYDENYLRMIQ